MQRCAQFQIASNVLEQPNQNFLFTKPSESLVSWLYSDVISEQGCEMHTRIQVLDAATGIWEQVPTELADWVWSASLAGAVRNVIERVPPDLSQKMTGIKLKSLDEYEAKWLKQVSHGSRDSSTVRLRVQFFRDLDFVSQADADLTPVVTKEFKLLIAPKQCTEAVPLHSTADQVTTIFGVVGQSSIIKWEEVATRPDGCPL